ncbi:MAG: roadblock/LC7 domain-containing protein [Dictyoglomaceae bacterium]
MSSSLLDYDFSNKCKEENFSFLILTSSEGLVLKSSLEDNLSEILGAFISIIYKESKNLFESSLKNDKIQELSLNGNSEKIIIIPFQVEEMNLLLIAASLKNKSIRRKLKKIQKEVTLCLQKF